MILAGDIGGTKTILALFRANDSKPRQIYQFKSKDFSDFSILIDKFLATTKPVNISSACFGIAGAVIDGRCQATNLPWQISTLNLSKQLDTDNIYLLNDLEATAHGMLVLSDDDFYTLQHQSQNYLGNKAVIAAGTGLGEAILFKNQDSFHPSASEGGHTDFAPASKVQDDLLVYLRQHYGLHVSYERVLSGPGIYMLYQFLKQTYHIETALDFALFDQDIDKSAIISEYAIKHNDLLCVKTMNLFAQIYGQEAGNLALNALSTGGLYIGGGIAPKIMPFLTDGTFLNAFLNKGRFVKLLKNIDIKISLNENTALLGAMQFAKDKTI